MMSDLKQVIVMRKDLNMRKGKMVAQGAHASLLVSLEMLRLKTNRDLFFEWVENGMTKICLSVDSEKELMDLYKRVCALSIPCECVLDAGRTEFNGVPTRTCLAIGPWYSTEIDRFTGELKLL